MPSRSKAANPLEDLFSETLKDVYFACRKWPRGPPRRS